MNEGDVFDGLEGNDEAMALYQKAQSLDPKDADEWLNSVFPLEERMEREKRKPRSDRFVTTAEELKEYNRIKQKESRERRKEDLKKYREEHREEHNKYQRDYYHKNKDKIKEQTKRYREKNRESIAKRQRDHYNEHKEECAAKAKEYREKNKAKCNEWHNNYMKKVFETYHKYKAIEEIAKSPIAIMDTSKFVNNQGEMFITAKGKEILAGIDFGQTDRDRVILCESISVPVEEKVS